MRKRDRILAENLIAVAAEFGRLDNNAKVEALRRMGAPAAKPKARRCYR
jgi:hypothetical protein